MPVILTVDDSRVARLNIKRVLTSIDCEIHEAENGRAGLTAVQEHKPDVILLDVTMPAMDGEAMLKELRIRGYSTPVILVTIESKTSTIASLVKEGAQDYVLKPFKPQVLKEKVLKAIADSTTAGAPTEAPQPKPSASSPQAGDAHTPGGALLVDDIANVAKKFRSLIPQEIPVQSFQHANDALQACSRVNFRVAVVDLVMPNVDTAQLIREMRKLQPGTPIYGLLMRNVKEPQQVAKEAGCDRYLVKPFDADQLEDLVEACVDDSAIVRVDGNVVSIAAFSGTPARQLRYFTKVKAALVDGINQLAEACYESAIIDTLAMPEVPDQLTRLLATAAQHAGSMGVTTQIVAVAPIKDSLNRFVETANLSVFDSVEAALDL